MHCAMSNTAKPLTPLFIKSVRNTKSDALRLFLDSDLKNTPLPDIVAKIFQLSGRNLFAYPRCLSAHFSSLTNSPGIWPRLVSATGVPIIFTPDNQRRLNGKRIGFAIVPYDANQTIAPMFAPSQSFSMLYLTIHNIRSGKPVSPNAYRPIVEEYGKQRTLAAITSAEKYAALGFEVPEGFTAPGISSLEDTPAP